MPAVEHFSVGLAVPHVQLRQPEAYHLISATLSPEINKPIRLLEKVQPNLLGVEETGPGRVRGPQIPVGQKRVEDALHVGVVSDQVREGGGQGQPGVRKVGIDSTVLRVSYRKNRAR